MHMHKLCTLPPLTSKPIVRVSSSGGGGAGGSFPPKREGKIGGGRGERERGRERERERERGREREGEGERERRGTITRHCLLLHVALLEDAWSSPIVLPQIYSLLFVISIVFYSRYGPQFQTSIPSYTELPVCQCTLPGAHR